MLAIPLCVVLYPCGTCSSHPSGIRTLNVRIPLCLSGHLQQASQAKHQAHNSGTNQGMLY